MKSFLSLLLCFFLFNSLLAQGTIYQLDSKQAVTQFAEAPQKFLGGLNYLRGFGCFLKINAEDERYEKLAELYQVGENAQPFLIFFVQAELYNQDNKLVSKTNTLKAQISPGERWFPGDLFFPGGLFEELKGGKYEMQLSVRPQEKVAPYLKMAKPDLRFRFEK